MLNLKGDTITLRALEPTDLDFLYRLENDTNVWEISGTITPYSKQVLKQYLENAHRDIYEVKQLRLCICVNEKVVGLIDLFDFDPQNNRAGLGIIVLEEKEKNKGIGTQAVELLVSYAESILNLHQIYVNVLEDNKISLHLFKKLGFVEIGIKKDWIRSKGAYKNEVLLQRIFK